MLIIIIIIRPGSGPNYTYLSVVTASAFNDYNYSFLLHMST